MNGDIIQSYEHKIAFAHAQAASYNKLVNTYSFIRLGAFLLLILIIVVAAVNNNYGMLGLSVLLFIILFGWLVSKQSEFEKRREYFHSLKKVNENEIASILTRSNIYNNGNEFQNEKHYYTSDLDIFGQASLFQLINRAATVAGVEQLAAWLNEPASKETILKRQQAVKELTNKKDWKVDFQAIALFAVKQDKNQLRQLFAYLPLVINMPHEKFLSIYCKLAPFFLLTIIFAAFFLPDAKYFIGVVLLINNRITSSNSEYIDKADLIAGRLGKTLAMYAEVFKKIEAESFESVYCRELWAMVKNEAGGSVSTRIKKLSGLINNLNMRLNIAVDFLLNAFLLWNIQQVMAIENWKRTNDKTLQDAFSALAQFEALISLAGVSINYPYWATPEIADGNGYTLNAQSIAHPLINIKTRVENSFELNDAFKIDIITGSNMAGKSTFLRTLGINTVLALAGAPVCAKSMKVSCMTIISYMRIKDSLNESTSTFKAELDRLQLLLQALESDQKVYFLIDEMLRGTNSVDKYRGSKAVIEQLIKKNGVGLVATHDLQIAHLEQKYPDYVRNFYFDIQIKDGEMLFDYKIKHGECKTFNAVLLLKQIGIDVDTAEFDN